jgi:hypothetical protein
MNEAISQLLVHRGFATALGVPNGRIGVQAMRKGHEVVVRVDLDEQPPYRALDYVRDSKTVVVRGVPVGGRGKQVLDNPITIGLGDVSGTGGIVSHVRRRSQHSTS